MGKGENELVEWLRNRFGSGASGVPVGIGDDMAIIDVDDNLLALTADMLMDGVHFDSREHSYDLIGRKALACSLSDCAAMGCQPRAATISVALPNSMSLDDVKKLYEGIAGIAEEFSCAIVGGDTNSWTGPLVIDVAMAAEPMAIRGPIRRSDAQVGDIIYVSGSLGGSINGRHLSFTPRIELASRLVHQPGLHAMMDISDGLSMDLHRLCLASHCAAEIDETALEPIISDAARELAKVDGRTPLEHALNDGEDFELLIVGTEALLSERFVLTAIGRIMPSRINEPIMQLIRSDGRRETLEPKGYEHFK
ncbi:MAG: thiamine-phosphate kinase [Phycisphaerae bacterium]|nr:thiamine-phosphate kinase [Phycisphaerae bacterium]